MVTTHYRCVIDIVQPVDNLHKSVEEHRNYLDKNIEKEFRNSIFDSLCNEDATVAVERITLEVSED